MIYIKIDKITRYSHQTVGFVGQQLCCLQLFWFQSRGAATVLLTDILIPFPWGNNCVAYRYSDSNPVRHNCAAYRYSDSIPVGQQLCCLQIFWFQPRGAATVLLTDILIPTPWGSNCAAYRYSDSIPWGSNCAAYRYSDSIPVGQQLCCLQIFWFQPRGAATVLLTDILIPTPWGSNCAAYRYSDSIPVGQQLCCCLQIFWFQPRRTATVLLTDILIPFPWGSKCAPYRYSDSNPGSNGYDLRAFVRPELH